MPSAWINWSGSLCFTPAEVAEPATERQVVELVRTALTEGRSLRPVGSGHSSSGILPTSGTLVSLSRLRGLIDADPAAGVATLAAGTVLHDAGRLLGSAGLALHNLGDIDRQAVIGAISTGTHGSGITLRNLSSALIGGRLVTGTGEVLELSEARDPELLAAARVSLGALGIFTAITLRLMPAYRLRRRQWCTRVADCLAHLDELIEHNRMFDFYWYPRSDEVKLRTMNFEDAADEEIPFARCVAEQRGWAWEVITQQRELKFVEMEYALPFEAGPACFREVRERVLARHRKRVGWRILYRTVAADDAWLSPAHGRPTVTISLHQNATLPWQEYFADIEPIFRRYGGRPHWGKHHSLTARELKPLYPQWDRFQAIRERLDPHGVLLSPELRQLLGDTSEGQPWSESDTQPGSLPVVTSRSEPSAASRSLRAVTNSRS